MRRAMAQARVGDDVFGDDPSVNRLQEMAAELVGKEAAIFLPSGTMANQVALRCHTEPGDRVLLEEKSHVLAFEAGAPAVISGVLPGPVPSVRGIMDPDDVLRAIPPQNVHFAPATLLCVENTSNRGGGSVYPLDVIDALTRLGHSQGIRLHLDGARIFNAALASSTSPARIARDFHTLSFCLSKGLGAPVGSLLCGTEETITKARRVRKMLGGGMRQAGFLAAAGIYALEHNVSRLALDHDMAHRLWEGLVHTGWEAQEPETNMVYVDAPGAAGTVARLRDAGVLAIATAPDRIRLVTHLDVNREGIEAAIAAFAKIRTYGSA